MFVLTGGSAATRLAPGYFLCVPPGRNVLRQSLRMGLGGTGHGFQTSAEGAAQRRALQENGISSRCFFTISGSAAPLALDFLDLPFPALRPGLFTVGPSALDPWQLSFETASLEGICWLH